ncbi:MAG: class I SAM-dependent methyltransferase [bacterium]
MNETSKTLQLLSERELGFLRGRGLDIGCGSDPVRSDVQRFDIDDGDANKITQYVTDLESFDYVFSSHCLEHMHDASVALAEWWKLVKPGGVMMVVVPDEDLYEQGYWPSLFNSDHKVSFTLSKEQSWSPVSRNLADLVRELPSADPVSLRLQDHRYRRTYLAPAVWPWSVARFATRGRNAVVRRLPALRLPLRLLYLSLRLPVDQTEGQATAQNIVIVAKRAALRM